RTPGSDRPSPRAVKAPVSIPDDVVLAPQAQVPSHAIGLDRSTHKGSARELSWAEFDRVVREMARQVAQRYRPDAVVGVAHGGVFVGGALASTLSCDF